MNFRITSETLVVTKISIRSNNFVWLHWGWVTEGSGPSHWTQLKGTNIISRKNRIFSSAILIEKWRRTVATSDRLEDFWSPDQNLALRIKKKNKISGPKFIQTELN